MQVLRAIDEIKKFRNLVQKPVGFVPTMGYLHAGHISLVNLAKKENSVVIVSIFVNPKQFGPNEDFNQYPRNEKHDLEILKKAGVDAVFLPINEELYPVGHETFVSLEHLSTKLEGKSRPGHFNGVATIVTMLLNIIQPNKAYFGQKDAQQVTLIKKMVRDLFIPAEIIVGETLRESDGLAMSSRNVYLTIREREEAPIIFKSLLLAKDLFTRGESNAQKIKTAMENLISITTGIVDYISIADRYTLEEMTEIEVKSLVSIAVIFGKTRLIDNIVLGSP